MLSFFFFFFLAAERSVPITELSDFFSMLSFFFFFFLAAERSVPSTVFSDFFSMLSFFFFFLAADRSSLFTTPWTAGVANAGRLTEVRKPSATAIAVILRIVFVLLDRSIDWLERRFATQRGIPC